MAARPMAGTQAGRQAGAAWAHARARTRVRTAGLSRELRVAGTPEAGSREGRGVLG